MSSTQPTAAMRCSVPSTRHAATQRRGSSERLPTRKARIGLVPEPDLVLALFPAEVDLAVAAEGGEVDEPAVEIADDDVDRVQLGRRRLQLEEGLRHDAAGLAAAVARGGLAERFARVLVREALAPRAQPLDALGHPRQRGI